MGVSFLILKCLADSEQILFEENLEDRAKRILRTLVEGHAEMMLSQNTKLSEDSALSAAESIFKIVEKGIFLKKRK
jgi:hypothetical protein